jgi:hypothetical protein
MTSPVVKLAGEGLVDIAILQRLATDVGLVPGDCYGLKGKSHLDQRTGNYNSASNHEPWLILRDLDHDCECPGALVIAKIGVQGRWLQYRVAVREVEVWLMADGATFCDKYHISTALLPRNLEALESPKSSILQLLAASRSRDIRESMVRARPGQPLRIGPEYNALLCEFALKHWNPTSGQRHSRSLERALVRLKEFAMKVNNHWNRYP